MRISFQNSASLGAIPPSYLQDYLKVQGWLQVASLEDIGTTWIFNSKDDQYSIFLPVSDTFSDYPLRVANILATLAEVEHLSINDIYRRIISEIAS